MNFIFIVITLLIFVIFINFIVLYREDIKVNNTIVKNIKNVPQENHLILKSDKILKSWFNPCFAETDNECHLFIRESSINTMFKKILLGYFNRKSDCEVITYDKGLKTQLRRVSLKNINLEDIRVIYFNNKIYSLGHSLVTRKIELNVLNDKFEVISNNKFRPSKEFSFLKIEKNWTFLPLETFTQNKIYIHYNTHPNWIVCSFDPNVKNGEEIELKEELKIRNIISENNTCQSSVGTSTPVLRNTSNWIKIEDAYYCMAHSKQRSGINFIICPILIKIDKTTWKPIKISNPLNLDKSNRRIQFPSGLHEMGGNIFLGMGINDEEISIKKFSKKYFEEIAFSV